MLSPAPCEPGISTATPGTCCTTMLPVPSNHALVKSPGQPWPCHSAPSWVPRPRVLPGASAAVPLPRALEEPLQLRSSRRWLHACGSATAIPHGHGASKGQPGLVPTPGAVQLCPSSSASGTRGQFSTCELTGSIILLKEKKSILT